MSVTNIDVMKILKFLEANSSSKIVSWVQNLTVAAWRTMQIRISGSFPVENCITAGNLPVFNELSMNSRILEGFLQ